MRNQDRWQATKFLATGSGIRVPAERGKVSAGSVLIATLVAQWYAKQLPLYATGTLLDLGCGKVPLYGMYRELVANIICTDWPYSLHGETFVDFASDLNGGIALADSTADTVILSDVLEHIYRPHALLKEVFRVLRPGGTVLLNMPFLYWLHEAPNDFYRYTPFAVERMAKDAGFELLRLDSIGNGVMVLTDVMGKLLMRYRRPGRFAASALQSFILRLCHEPPRVSAFPLFVAAVLRRP